MLPSSMNGQGAEKLSDPGLVDFGLDASGSGRRLELLGGVLVDRPLPATRASRQLAAWWSRSAASFVTDHWQFQGPLPEPWQIEVPLSKGQLHLEVRPAPSGQVGIFLEQIPQWRWLTDVTPSGARMLSLFGHSGAATLAMAAAGASVVHVDASRQATGLARRNAVASGLDTADIRWICEDAGRFVSRELRRGHRYDGVVLDPPSWGHGPRGQAFSIERDLEPLLADCMRLLAPASGSGGPILLTCHSPQWPHQRLRTILHGMLHQSWSSHAASVRSGGLFCLDASGRSLDLGGYARWTAHHSSSPG
jgi:23S rRNA (cytosine1962-C5)-methyltransferase